MRGHHRPGDYLPAGHVPGQSASFGVACRAGHERAEQIQVRQAAAARACWRVNAATTAAPASVASQNARPRRVPPRSAPNAAVASGVRSARERKGVNGSERLRTGACGTGRAPSAASWRSRGCPAPAATAAHLALVRGTGRPCSRRCRRHRQAHAPEAAAARDAARHGTQVAQALRRQAAGISVPQVHPVAIRHSGLSARRQRLEEAALASVAGPPGGRAGQIAQMLPPEAFGDYYRPAVYAVACQMHRDGRHVDELTLDWEVARLGLPLRYEPGGQAIGARLARLRSGDQRPIEAARQLQEQYGQARGPRALAPALASGRPGSGMAERARGPGGQPSLRLVQPPPGHELGSPGHGPRPAPRLCLPDLASLVASVRSAGLDVKLEADPSARGSGDVEAAAYRVLRPTPPLAAARERDAAAGCLRADMAAPPCWGSNALLQATRLDA